RLHLRHARCQAFSCWGARCAKAWVRREDGSKSARSVTGRIAFAPKAPPLTAVALGRYALAQRGTGRQRGRAAVSGLDASGGGPLQRRRETCASTLQASSPGSVSSSRRCQSRLWRVTRVPSRTRPTLQTPALPSPPTATAPGRRVTART